MLASDHNNAWCKFITLTVYMIYGVLGSFENVGK